MRLGIDASNIRSGGGLTHLVHLLGAANPLEHDIEHVTVFSKLRLRNAAAATEYSRGYTWVACARRTFEFFSAVHRAHDVNDRSFLQQE
jgi:hypothetical protein